MSASESGITSLLIIFIDLITVNNEPSVSVVALT